MKLLIILLYILSTAAPAADSFEVLRNNEEGFAKVVPGKALKFPTDHNPHPDYRIEWWYITANLEDEQGRHWGLQWTLFRQAMSAKPEQQAWSNNQLWMAHAAISTPDAHQFEERFSRGGIGQAGVKLDDQFEAWIDDWHWRSDSNTLFPSILTFSLADREIKMRLISNKDWVMHGEDGYSRKSQQGQASYYYSQPNIRIKGTIGDVQLSGHAWLDREWSSQPLASDQQGWDWFSLHLNDGNRIMLYRLRHDDGQHWLSGSWIDNNGNRTHLNGQDIEMSEKQFRQIKRADDRTIKLPLDWQISLPGQGRNLFIKPLYDQQWMATSFPYWEGVVLVENDKGESVGKGYMELTGYQ